MPLFTASKIDAASLQLLGQQLPGQLGKGREGADVTMVDCGGDGEGEENESVCSDSGHQPSYIESPLLSLAAAASKTERLVYP